MAVDNGYTNFYYDDRIGRTALIPHDANAHYFTISNGSVLGVDKKQVYADGTQYIDGVLSFESTQLQHFLGSWNNQHGNFEIAELLCYNVKHNESQQNKVELYLKTKYGL